jgi:hypothetical protein
MMGRVNRDDRPIAIAIALGVCALVYAAGAVAIWLVGSMVDMSDDVSNVLGVLLLIASLMAAVVIMLRDKSRRI